VAIVIEEAIQRITPVPHYREKQSALVSTKAKVGCCCGAGSEWPREQIRASTKRITPSRIRTQVKNVLRNPPNRIKRSRSEGEDETREGLGGKSGVGVVLRGGGEDNLIGKRNSRSIQVNKERKGGARSTGRKSSARDQRHAVRSKSPFRGGKDAKH